MNLIFSLRALAARNLPRAHHLDHGNAAYRAAIRVGCSIISSGNEPDTGQNTISLRMRYRSLSAAVDTKGFFDLIGFMVLSEVA
ncbi:hypothetical protein [Cognatishimia sp. 1_MG-2023]|uniref:hypothetical protein n=1 Tax=Cognatishimia sp. 1_MG-2023 TaxID=3062642 RepID=UPI0026E28505|nr:hypothetical protein [Cognatishimia sp. 1_MG-2023]